MDPKPAQYYQFSDSAARRLSLGRCVALSHFLIDQSNGAGVLSSCQWWSRWRPLPLEGANTTTRDRDLWCIALLATRTQAASGADGGVVVATGCQSSGSWAWASRTSSASVACTGRRARARGSPLMRATGRRPVSIHPPYCAAATRSLAQVPDVELAGGVCEPQRGRTRVTAARGGEFAGVPRDLQVQLPGAPWRLCAP
jgi:hypothetical protein